MAAPAGTVAVAEAAGQSLLRVNATAPWPPVVTVLVLVLVFVIVVPALVVPVRTLEETVGGATAKFPPPTARADTSKRFLIPIARVKKVEFVVVSRTSTWVGCETPFLST